MGDLNKLKLVFFKKKEPNKWLAKQLRANLTTVSKRFTNTVQPYLATMKRFLNYRKPCERFYKL